MAVPSTSSFLIYSRNSSKSSLSSSTVFIENIISEVALNNPHWSNSPSNKFLSWFSFPDSMNFLNSPNISSRILTKAIYWEAFSSKYLFSFSSQISFSSLIPTSFHVFPYTFGRVIRIPSPWFPFREVLPKAYSSTLKFLGMKPKITLSPPFCSIFSSNPMSVPRPARLEATITNSLLISFTF